MRAASRNDWDNKPLPEQHATLKVERRFSEAEMDAIRHGFVPWEMGQKWFIYFEDNTLYMHRSWTGSCIYVAKFRKVGDEYEITHLLANRDPEQVKHMDDAEYVAFFLETLDGYFLRHVPPLHG
jgi:hypothetical protein